MSSGLDSASWSIAVLNILIAAAWQGAVVGGAYAALVRFGPSFTPADRCRLARLALLVIAAAPVATALVPGAVLHAWAIPSGLSAHRGSALTARQAVVAVDMAWAIGACLVLGRGFAGLPALVWLQQSATAPSAALRETFERLCTRLGVQGATLRLSSAISGPCVVGAVRVIVYLPISATTSLDAGQIEAILVHELAHVMRRDFAWNVVRRFVEAALFFHPVVWRLSRDIDLFQELACDDVVIADRRAPLAYAEALVRLAELAGARKTAPRTPAVAAMGDGASDLARRVHRILGVGAAETRPGGKGALLMLGGVLLLAAAAGAVDVQKGRELTYADAIADQVAGEARPAGTTSPSISSPEAAHRLQRPRPHALKVSTTPIGLAPSGGGGGAPQPAGVSAEDQARAAADAALNALRIQHPVSAVQQAEDAGIAARQVLRTATERSPPGLVDSP